MSFDDDLVRLRHDPEIVRLALRRADSHEAAQDALQETYYNVARVPSESIRDLRAFYCKALIHEIARPFTRPRDLLVEDAGTPGHTPQDSNPSAPSDDEACAALLARTLLTRLTQRHDPLMASVPGRSPDHQRYRTAIAAAAARILRLLLVGHVAPADWNFVLKDEYPQYFDEPQLARDAKDQRLSRARHDVRDLLRKIVKRAELAV
jgi:hypothetical protein